MEREPLISIIVPVYNVEKYLSKCIDSILSQTYRNFELLLIDDGSTDASCKICDDYETKDKRIKVFHQKNSGVSASRQYGTEAALGEFIIHIDSDDWIDSDMIKNLVETAITTQSDVVICDITMHRDSKVSVSRQVPKEINPQSMIYGMLTDLHGSCCNKLISKRYYKMVGFPKNINITEDLIYNLQVFLLNPKISYIDRPFYHYRIDNNVSSQSKNFTKCQFTEIKKAFHEANKHLEGKTFLTLLKKKYLPFLVYCGMKAPDVNRSDLLKALEGYYFFYFFKTKSPMKIKIALLLNIMGLRKLVKRYA